MSGTTELTYVDFQRRDAAQTEEWDRRTAVKAAVERGAEALVGSFDDASRWELRDVVVDVLAPALLGSDGRWIGYYTDRLADEEDFYPLALGRLYSGRADSDDLVRSYYSLAAIAEEHGVVENVTNYAEVDGFRTRLARMWLRYDMDVGGRIQLPTLQSGAPKTLFCGKTGRGKSASLEAAVADRYATGWKILDLVDLDEYENAVYDVPQRQPELRAAREDLGLPPDYTDDDVPVEDPEVEILVPLTPESADMAVPLADDGTTSVRPFSVPAEGLDKTTLVSFMAAMVSKQQETAIRTAYNAAPADASLGELAERIADRDDLEDKYQKRVLKLLENLQKTGFIRDASDEYALDWGRIFTDTDTITAFSVAPLSDPTDRLMVLSYLVSQVYERRRQLDGLPRSVLVARELHEVAPHQNETAEDNRAEALQKAIASNLSKLLKKNRHVRLEVLADTQDVKDLSRGVRQRFSRFVAFKMPKASLRECVETTGVGWNSRMVRHLPDERGKSMVIGDHGASLPYLSPVEWAPGPLHHFDVDENPDGLRARAAYLDRDMAPAPWDDDGRPPEDLVFSASVIADEGDGVDTPDDGAYRDFAAEFIVEEDGGELDKNELYEAFLNWSEEIGGPEPGRKNVLSRKINASQADVELKSRSGVYEGYRLTSEGRRYLDPAGETEAYSDM